MKKIIRILSALLAVLMVSGAVTVIGSAIPLTDEDGVKIGDSLGGSIKGEVDYEATIESYLNEKNDATLIEYKTPQEKIASMKMMWGNHGYQLWVDEATGEVATVKTSTGEILFTNPWNTSKASYYDEKTKKDKTTSLAIKKQLLSQLVVNYVDNDTTKTMYSCEESAMRDQINVEYIKNGIRVEYSIGRESTRMLVPKLIEKTRFETKILLPMRNYFTEQARITISDGTIRDENDKPIRDNTAEYPNGIVGESYGFYELLLMDHPDFDMTGAIDLQLDKFEVKKVAAYYTLKDTSTAASDREKSEIEAAFPITKKMAVYVFDPGASTTEMNTVEQYIKNYAITYTYEDMDYDHELTEYVGFDKPPALFKMALEYTLDKQGMNVRLPANGIRFDESLYQLESVEMLPYMGAGQNDGDWDDGGDGYTFFPDGSGTLFDFEQLNKGKNKTVTGKVYGQDFAYHKITGTHQETIRYPAFGIVEYWEGEKTVTDYDTVLEEAKYDKNGNLISPAKYATETVTAKEDKGFLAIIEEGDALAELSTFHMSATSIYNTVKMVFYPRPKDSYNMSDAISVGANTVMTVVSSRKYVGNYRVRYIMLSDDELAKENKLSKYYECSWMGMAVAYRDYLEQNSILSRLDETDVDDDIPLYIETFGTLMTTEKIMSIPVDVMTPLTTFGDIKTMYNELSDAIKDAMSDKVSDGNTIGITEESAKDFSNINFKLTGYANGGMYSNIPYHLNWEAAVGGADGFQELIDDAKKEGYGIFPDFDFVYVNNLDILDGVDLKNDAVKTIDNRYTSRREYSATLQTYVGYFQYAIAPSSFDRFVSKLSSNYVKYNPIGISVSTLGKDLNSDFDEDDPLNREDSKKFTMNALWQLSLLKTEDNKSVEVMVDGGNAYTWRYIDYIVNMPLNSSRYNDSSNAVPFIGVVLHGYVQYAGTPINEEGDIQNAFLKAIENGASLYFTFAYQNTQKLKEDSVLSQHYSVRYDIWKDDVVEMYTELNDLLCDLQTKLIIDHDFIIGERVPDSDEIIADAEALAKAEAEKKAAEELEAAKEALKAALELRHTPTKSIEAIVAKIEAITEQAKTIAKYSAKINPDVVNDCVKLIATANEINAELNEAKKNVYYEESYNLAAEAARALLSDAILSNAMAAADRIYAAAIEGITDEAKLQEMKSAVAYAEELIVRAAINAGVEEAFRIATSEKPVYKSSAEESAALVVENQKVISAVVDAATDASKTAYINTSDEYKELIEGISSAILEGILTVTDETLVRTAIDDAKKAYDKSYNAIIKSIDAASKAIVDRKNAIDKAIAGGVDEALVLKAIELKTDYDMLAKQVSSLEGNSTKYQAALKSLVSKKNAYHKALDQIYNIVTTDKDLQTVMKTINAYYSADAEATMYELSASIDQATATSSSKEDAEKKRESAEELKVRVEEIDANLRATAETMIAEVEVTINAAIVDCLPLYEEGMALLSAYYGEIEKIYVKAAGSDAALVEAVKLLNDNKKFSMVLDLAEYFNDCNNSYASNKAYAQAVAAMQEVKDGLAAVDATVRKAADKIVSDNSSAVSKISRKDYDNKLTVIKAVFAMVEYIAAEDARDVLVDGYKDFADNIDTAREQKDEANELLQNEAIALAKKAADEAYTAAADAYKAVAKDEALKTAADIAALIDKINTAQANFDTAKAAYEIQKELYESEYGYTAAEAKDYTTKLNAYNTAKSALEAAQAEYDKAYEASNVKTEFQAVVDAYRNALTAKNNNSLITAAMEKVTAAVNAEFGLDAAMKAAVELNAEYLTIQNKISAITDTYSDYVKKINTAFESVKVYNVDANIAMEEALKATYKQYADGMSLEERCEVTKEEAKVAENVLRTYASALYVASKQEEVVLADKYLDIITDTDKANAEEVMATTLDALKAALDAASDADKAQAQLLYNIALAVSENELGELKALAEKANADKITADKNVISAEQFFETAKNDCQLAIEYITKSYNGGDSLNKIFANNETIFYGEALMITKEIFLGDKNMSGYETAVNKEIKNLNDTVALVGESVEKMVAAWATIEAAAAEYSAAQAELDKLAEQLANGEINSSTYRVGLIYWSHKMINAEAEVNAANAVITEAQIIFADDFDKLETSLKSIAKSLDSIKTEAETANKLYEHLASTSSDASLIAMAKEKAEKYTASMNAVKESYEALSAAYKTICTNALDIGLIEINEDVEANGTAAYIVVEEYTKHTEFSEKLFGNALEEDEVYEKTKYTVSDGSIVAVTYGGKGGDDNSAYRTFLLNYNSFSVTFEYNNVKYELAPYGYCVINY